MASNTKSRALWLADGQLSDAPCLVTSNNGATWETGLLRCGRLSDMRDALWHQEAVRLAELQRNDAPCLVTSVREWLVAQ